MSTTYSIVCDECKKSCWVGQGDRIYAYRYIADFLHEHTGHSLRFLNDHVGDELSENYESYEDTLSTEERNAEKEKFDAIIKPHEPEAPKTTGYCEDCERLLKDNEDDQQVGRCMSTGKHVHVNNGMSALCLGSKLIKRTKHCLNKIPIMTYLVAGVMDSRGGEQGTALKKENTELKEKIAELKGQLAAFSPSLSFSHSYQEAEPPEPALTRQARKDSEEPSSKEESAHYHFCARCTDPYSSRYQHGVIELLPSQVITNYPAVHALIRAEICGNKDCIVLSLSRIDAAVRGQS